MGLIVLHSAHFSKIFKRLMGTTCNLKWREIGEKERVWVVNPAHPIADGLSDYFEIPHAEMYGEPFGIPEPDSLVFTSWFEGGEVFRSGCCWYRGRGKVFYFRPGHETYPIYYQPEIRQVIANAVKWAAPTNGPQITVDNRKEPLEPVRSQGTPEIMNLQPYLDFALEATWQAGRITLGYFQTGVTVERKSDNTPVTAADRAAEKRLRSADRRALP